MEIKTDELRGHNGSDISRGSNSPGNGDTGISELKKDDSKKEVSEIGKKLNKENEHFTESKISVSLRRSGVNSWCGDYPISSSNMTIPSDKQLLIVFLFPETALYPGFANMSICVAFGSRCKLIFVPTKVTEKVERYIFEEADFILFHLSGLQSDITFTDYLRSLHYPGVRNPSQRWVLVNQPAPVYSSASTDQLASLEGWFNFTMSYSHLADNISLRRML